MTYTDDAVQAFQTGSASAFRRAIENLSEDNNGGSSSPNWCLVQVNGPLTPLTAGAFEFIYAESDLEITQQSGDDFTLGTYQGNGAIFSASGGLFQAGVCLQMAGLPDSGLDPGIPGDRFVQLGFVIGDLIPDLGNLGFDYSFKIGSIGNICVASLPGVASPGGPTFHALRFVAANLAGTDSVGLDTFDFPCLVVWQIA